MLKLDLFFFFFFSPFADLHLRLELVLVVMAAISLAVSLGTAPDKLTRIFAASSVAVAASFMFEEYMMIGLETV
jgi:hypothetical protein